MVLLPGGAFVMGTDSAEGFPADGEGPAHEVRVEPFRIDRCAVTNAEFRLFVDATGHETEAERFGWSFVFGGFVPPWAARHVRGEASGAPWWLAVEKACWDTPEGPGSGLERRWDHPVVHISWNDARAYCAWSGRRLPTEAEWEFAARGGLVGKRYPWGDELLSGGRHRCNIWQGTFPARNLGEDGYLGTAPARSFPPNGYELYNVAGNVWEWCSDRFAASYYAESPHRDPQGPSEGEPRVMRGGSYLCHESYCNRYRVAARSSNTPESSTGNTGFRCAANA
jgi:formylglycine-generating enzyme required for sulfatase activity